jgi:hypothetical protein
MLLEKVYFCPAEVLETPPLERISPPVRLKETPLPLSPSAVLLTRPPPLMTPLELQKS